MSDIATPEDLLRTAFVIGRVGPKSEALALFDTLLADVKASAWDEGWDVGRRLQGPHSNPYKRNENA